MKLSNLTHWRTADVRAFVVRVARDELDPAKRKELRVRVEYARARRGLVSGRAWIGGESLTVRLPRNDVDKIGLATALAHEMAHARGLDHAAMRGAARYHRGPETRARYSWALDLPLRLTPAARLKCETRGRIGRRRFGRCPNRARYRITDHYDARDPFPPRTHLACPRHTGGTVGEHERPYKVALGLDGVQADRIGRRVVEALDPPGAPRAEIAAVRREARLAHALAMVAAWERKLKRGQTALKTWRRRAARLTREATRAAELAAKKPLDGSPTVEYITSK